MREKFRSNQHGQQDVPTNKRQRGDINTNHSPPSAIASPSWCVQRPPEGSSHPPHQPKGRDEKEGRVAASHHLPLLPNTHPSRGFLPPVARNQKEYRPAQADSPITPQSNPKASPGFTKLYWSFSPTPPPHRPRIALPTNGAPRAPPDRRAAGENRVRGGGGREPRRGGAAGAKFPGV